MGPTWGPLGADRTLVGPMLAPWTLLSGLVSHFRYRHLWTARKDGAMACTCFSHHCRILVRIFPQKGPVMQICHDLCFDDLNKLLNEQSSCRLVVWDAFMLMWSLSQQNIHRITTCSPLLCNVCSNVTIITKIKEMCCIRWSYPYQGINGCNILNFAS